MVALRHAETILAKNRRIVQTNDHLVTAFMAEHADLFEYASPDGGCVAFLRYLGEDGVERFCANAVTEHGVLLLPSSVYRSDLADVPTDRFRMGIGRTDVGASLAALGDHLATR